MGGTGRVVAAEASGERPVVPAQGGQLQVDVFEVDDQSGSAGVCGGVQPGAAQRFEAGDRLGMQPPHRAPVRPAAALRHFPFDQQGDVVAHPRDQGAHVETTGVVTVTRVNVVGAVVPVVLVVLVVLTGGGRGGVGVCCVGGCGVEGCRWCCGWWIGRWGGG